MLSVNTRFQVIIIGGGHAGVEAAWAAANVLATRRGDMHAAGSVALVTLDPSKIGVMSCNPAIGGLAKGQIVRELDALGGLMGLATDATGIQFKVLNTSKGAAVRGPRAQCDKHAYAECVQGMIASRPEIVVVAGSVERLEVERGPEGDVIRAVVICGAGGVLITLSSDNVVLTTGTFMRGLMHTGEHKTPGGRFGESAAMGISGALSGLGFELGRLKTGTPPRLSKKTIDWASLADAPGDDEPVPFSDLTRSLGRFPVLTQVMCKATRTCAAVHDAIRANLHRAPMYSGQIESVGPRYCPSIEDKVVRFAEREEHGVFLEPESLRPGHDDWVYCNGISTSLPADVQDQIVRGMPGCERAEVLRYGYAVEYDMVKPHQIFASGMTKRVEGLFLAGQINGTSGYEEAAAQGLVAGLNAAKRSIGEPMFTFGREQAYIGVLMDDLVTKTPTEPYRMFTSRAEHRLLLRADNAADRLTPIADGLGLLGGTKLGAMRSAWFASRRSELEAISQVIESVKHEGVWLRDLVRRPEFGPEELGRVLAPLVPGVDERSVITAHTNRFYAAYIDRQQAEVRRSAEMERRLIPMGIDYFGMPSLRAEAKQSLDRFRPATLGQAARLEGITPADVTLLSVLIRKTRAQAGGAAGEAAG
jgi:tRNA uridine 5-carboxymethylaminomethyl modification enzyme